MKILFFYPSLNIGGQQTQTYNLAKNLADMGHSVYWLYQYGTGMDKYVSATCILKDIGVKSGVKDYLFRPWRVLILSKKIRKYCLDNEIDLIISGCGLSSLSCGIASMRLNVVHFRLIGCSLMQVEKLLYRVYKYCMIDRVIDGYFGWNAVFRELENKGVRKEKFFELKLGVDTEEFHPLTEVEKSKQRKKLGILEGEVVIGWVGRISKDMQVGNTIYLGSELCRKGLTNIRLLIVGGGPWCDELRDLIEDLNLSNKSILTDWVPIESVNSLINAMDFVPLLEADPQGGSIVREAMAAGKIAVSVDGVSGAQREFMFSDSTVLVNPENNFIELAANAIIELAQNPQEMKKLGINARKFAVNNMSFRKQAETIVTAFSIVSSRLD